VAKGNQKGKMNDIAGLDETDIKILNRLIIDARTRLKDIAEECETSSVSVLNRIKRLKNLKIITGSTLSPNVALIGLPVIATIGINIDGNKEGKVFKALEEQSYLIEPSESLGEYDLCALVFAKDLSDLDKIACSIKEKFSAQKVTINVWSGTPQLVFENIDLQPIRRQK
jgi:Lrp/AsnC family transcriptional regulator, regulator for asnA, asnC and gidA